MADGLALGGFVKSSRRIVNVGTASIVAAMNRLRKRAARRFYPVCCSGHRNFVNWTFRRILQWRPPKNRGKWGGRISRNFTGFAFSTASNIDRQKFRAVFNVE
jgi:hypothetical protein